MSFTPFEFRSPAMTYVGAEEVQSEAFLCSVITKSGCTSDVANEMDVPVGCRGRCGVIPCNIVGPGDSHHNVLHGRNAVDACHENGLRLVLSLRHIETCPLLRNRAGRHCRKHNILCVHIIITIMPRWGEIESSTESNNT